MEDKIEVGDYIRTKSGEIYKETDCEIRDNKVITYAGGEYMVSDKIVKHSKELKDLIESGDLIIYRLRGLKHQGKGFIRIYKDARSGKEIIIV